jgi:hypothetical protein
MIVPGPGTVAGGAAGAAIGITVSAVVSDMMQASIEAGPVKRFMAKSKNCDKVAKQESAAARARGTNAVSSAPPQMFVISRYFGVFAMYPYTIASPPTLLGDRLYTTYGPNPRDPVTQKFGP